MTLGLTAQERLVLFEEFTGENCGPCAANNPGLMQKVNNNDDVLIIKYQSPIPSGGPIYQQNTVDIQARMSYYSVPFAPYGRIDGEIVGSGEHAGNVSLTTPQMLTDAANVPAPVDIEIVNYNRVIGSSTVNFDVKVTSPTAQNFSNAVVHVGLIESLFFDTPPGTNGETEFYNVVRKMYPNASGQAMQSSFTANESQTFTITAELPSFVDPNSTDIRFVAFAQTNDDKKVLNATVTRTVEKDLYSLDLSSPFLGSLLCGVESDVMPSSKFKNVGSETVTSADIYYRTTDGTTTSNWVSGQWTGTLEPGKSTTFDFTGGLEGMIGRFAIQDSIGMINGVATENDIMKSSSNILVALKTDAEDLFPYATTLEVAADREAIISSGINGGMPFNIYTGNGIGYDQSLYFLAYLNYSLAPGSQGVAVLPYMEIPTGEKALDFYVAYAQYSNENDKLEVVYSTDCGSTWTSIWSKQGQELATTSPKTSQFLPNSNNHYRKEEVDITDVPDGAYIGFKATSDYGNNLFVDNINLRTGGVSTKELMNDTKLMVFPNPTNADINLKIESDLTGKASVVIHDVLGRQVHESNVDLNGSSQIVNLAVSHLSAGIYAVQLITEKGTQQLKFTKN